MNELPIIYVFSPSPQRFSKLAPRKVSKYSQGLPCSIDYHSLVGKKLTNIDDSGYFLKDRQTGGLLFLQVLCKFYTTESSGLVLSLSLITECVFVEAVNEKFQLELL